MWELMLRRKIKKLPDGRVLSPLLCGPELYQVLAWMRFRNAKPGEWPEHMALYESAAAHLCSVCYEEDGSLCAVVRPTWHMPN
jgi:hypothetical protein